MQPKMRKRGDAIRKIPAVLQTCYSGALVRALGDICVCTTVLVMLRLGRYTVRVRVTELGSFRSQPVYTARLRGY